MKPRIYPFEPFPTLSTSRMSLRKMEESDAADVLALRSHPQLIEFVDRPLLKQIKEADFFIFERNQGIDQGSWIFWALSPSDQKALWGSICLWNFDWKRKKADVGYEIHPLYQRKGLMNEALIAVIDYGFRSLDLHSIEAFTHYANLASVGLLQKNGFQAKEEVRDPSSPEFITFELIRDSSHRRC